MAITTPAPTTVPQDPFTALLSSVSLDGGAALQTSSTPQNDALTWLAGNTNLGLPATDDRWTQKISWRLLLGQLLDWNNLCMSKWYVDVLSQSKSFASSAAMSNDTCVDALDANGPSKFGQTEVNTSQWCYGWQQGKWLCHQWISCKVPLTLVKSSSIGTSVCWNNSLPPCSYVPIKQHYGTRV